MAIQWKQVRIGLTLGLALLGLSWLLSGIPSGPVDAQAQATMTRAEWQSLARQVAANLERIGIQMGVAPQVRAVYVPALTQEYLEAFGFALQQGASKPQADRMASQYIAARIQQLRAQGGNRPSPFGHREYGSVIGGGGTTGYIGPDGSGVTCGPDGGCIYSR